MHREIDDLESQDVLEATVPGCKSESVLFAQRRDPDVVLLYRNACSPEGSCDLTENASALAVEFEYADARCGEEAFERSGVLSQPGSVHEAEPELPEHHHRQTDGLGLAGVVGQLSIALA